jgi:hypothetical protein
VREILSCLNAMQFYRGTAVCLPNYLQNTRFNKSLLMQIAGENSSPLTK